MKSVLTTIISLAAMACASSASAAIATFESLSSGVVGEETFYGSATDGGLRLDSYLENEQIVTEAVGDGTNAYFSGYGLLFQADYSGEVCCTTWLNGFDFKADRPEDVGKSFRVEGSFGTIFATIVATEDFVTYNFDHAPSNLFFVRGDGADFYGQRFAIDNIRYEGPIVGVPEPSTWALLIGGFGLAGAQLRRRSTRKEIR